MQLLTEEAWCRLSQRYIFDNRQQESEQQQSESCSSSSSSLDNDDELLRSYFTLFGKPTLYAAFELLERKCVRKIVAENSERVVYAVHDAGANLVCLPHHYCTCTSFAYRVLRDLSELTCVHLVATRLAASLHSFSGAEESLCVVERIDDIAFGKLLSDFV
jgi:predicted nucleic acid-binding Zn finger protein